MSRVGLSGQVHGETVLRPALQRRPLEALGPVIDEADGLHLDDDMSANVGSGFTEEARCRQCSHFRSRRYSQAAVRGNLMNRLVTPR